MLFTDNSNWFLDPWDEFNRMNRTASRMNALRTPEFPSVNTWVSSDDSIVTTEIPGVDPDSIDISVSGRAVTIKGSRKPEELSGDQTFHRRERWNGGFSKTIELPFNIEAGKVSATFKKGVLYLSLPRAEAEKPKKIEISSN